jgi:hypothetical protein
MTTSATTLRDTIANLSALPDDATLFVERIDGAFRPASRVTAVVLSDEDFERPLAEVAASRAEGCDYFLESFAIVELLDAWGGAAEDEPVLDAFVARVIEFAEQDALNTQAGYAAAA